MSSDVLKRNQKALEQLKKGEIPEDKQKSGIGSFFMILFEEEGEDCIPLFFEFLGWKFGKDYSRECEWVLECLEESHESFNEFEEMIREFPLMALLLAMSD